MAWIFWIEFTVILMILTFWEDEDENEEEKEKTYDVKQHLPTKGIGCTFTAEDVREALKK